MRDSKTYTVYIMASRSRRVYIGITSGLELRVQQHKDKTFEGFTSTYNCNRLVWYRHFEHPSEAIAWEKKLKGWLRARKLELVREMNPTWEDLSSQWGKPIKLYGEE